ncbi:MAG: hypothetical protein LBS69_08145 [Prevotellaceae bacterium]|jgi:chromosome segregation ATPase|nr:hypothetical protein [Prevotellaceae bacterium]
MKGIIESLGLKEIQDEIKSLTAELETLKASLTNIGEDFTAAFKEIGALLKEVKKSANFTELRENGEKTTKKIQEVSAAMKEQAAQQKTIETLTARLSALENEEAKEVQRLKIEIAEKNRQQKIEAQASLSLQKDINGLIAAYKEQSGSIRELTARNKELRTARDSLNTETQKADIEELNKIIDANTAVIKANQDSYVQQKMTIGDYKTAIEGVKVQINGAQALMVKIAEETGKDSKEYLNASASLNELNKQLEDYVQSLSNAEQGASPLKKRLSELKREMEDLNHKGSSNWTDEQSQAYNKAATEAKKLQKAISALDFHENFRKITAS